jgi:5-methyltetrahydropteroyltriglutamate--homocysteine methyltransferase
MQRSEDRILTTHVGSLVRPAELLTPTAGSGKDPGAAWRDRGHQEATLSKAVDVVVAEQAACGIDIINDGEFGRAHFANYILNRVSGFEMHPEDLVPAEWLGRERERFPEYLAEIFPAALAGNPVQVCVGPILYVDHGPIRRDTARLTAALAAHGGREGFFTAVAPAMTAFDGRNGYYSSERDYLFAIAEALREEYREIIDAGLLLQVDDPILANMWDALVSKSPAEYRRWAELRIAALNHALDGIPPEKVRYHMCFGSWHMPHTSDAPLEEVLGFVLQVNAGAYLIESANVRHEHEWRVWEKVRLPEGKVLVPGVVTHHTVSVEHPRLVADRIVRFARLLGRQNVIAGTDCGFAQLDMVRRVHPSIMWAKLESLVEGARIASDELWGRRG